MAQQHHGTNYGNMPQPAPPSSSRGVLNQREALLLLYVVDYCEKRGYKEAATALKREGRLVPEAKPPIDSKEGLLFEWWTCFWEVYTARVHPEKHYSIIAKIYSDNLHLTPFGQQQNVGQPSNSRPGASQPSSAGQPAPGVNGQPPTASYSTNPANVNGVQPPSNAVAGMPGPNPTLHNPNLQHLQQPRMGYPTTGQGMPMQPVYMQQQQQQQQQQRPITLVQMGPMGGQMQQHQQRMVNGAAPYPNPNYRPQPGQSPQQQHMQTTGNSGSPKQPGAPSTAQNSSPHNGQGFESSGMDSQQQQGTPRMQPNRGQKRPSPGDDEYKDGSPPSNKKPRRSPQENGAALPSTPSLPAAQPPGNGRMSTGNFNGMAPNKTTPVMTPMSFPQGPHGGGPNGAALGPGMPPAMVGQLRELAQTHMRTQPTPTHQTDQQYFAQMQQTAVNTYNIKPTYPATPNPSAAGQPGAPTETSVRGATNAPKGSMLPPPPPSSSTNQPTPGTANGTPGKNTPVMSGLVPRNAANKDGSSPSGLEGSPESVRPGSRPIPGSTPQMTPAPIPGTASTPGGGQPSISAPSPGQMATPQQISRPQTQSPSSAALARPSTANSNAATPNPSALLARYSGSAPSNGANGAPGGGATNPTTSNSMGGPTGMLGGSEPLPNDLFMSLSNSAPFDFQMMNYQEDDAFAGNMNFDFASTLGMDDNYSMSMYINEGGLDSVNGS